MIKLQDIFDQNPWWVDGSVLPEEAGWPHRAAYAEINAAMERRFVQVIIGLRRVGKSTLLKQVIAGLLGTGIAPKRIFYFSFDKYAVAKTPEALDEVLDRYFDDVLGERPPMFRDMVYVLLDEIQYVDLWRDLLKRYYDQSRLLKLVVSGSQSARLKGASSDSLAGRIVEHTVPPLPLREYAVQKAGIVLNPAMHIGTLLDGTASLADLQKAYLAHQAFYVANMPGYLMHGQFPEVVAESDVKQAYDYIENSVLGKILEVDLPVIYKIDNRESFKAMGRHLVRNSGSLFELKNIASEIGVSVLTCEHYLSCLKNGYIVDTLFRSTKSEIKQGRTLKKAYALSPNLTAAVLRVKPEEFDTRPEVCGRIVETYAWQRLAALGADMSFWRKGPMEIDFLITTIRGRPVPVEAKYSSRLRGEDLNALVEFCGEKKISDAIVMTRDFFDTITRGALRIRCLPYCMA